MSKAEFGEGSFWQCLFSPSSVAMIGASDIVGSWGFNITQRLIQSANLRIFPVNPGHPTVQGMSALRSVVDIPETPDLAIIAVPAPRVSAVMLDCVNKGIKAALVVSGGFSETDDEGRKLEAQITAIARQGHLRFVGPNTMGHANTHAHFSSLGFMGKLVQGCVGFAAQSGNMGSRIMQLCMNEGVGFSKFVCSGNEASIRLEDYLEYFAQDDDTKVIVFYIEGLREAPRFMRLARTTVINKPIVVMKAGGTNASKRAARSHTGVLAGVDSIYSAAFRQAGVIRADNEDELADVVAALVKQPLPKGPQVAILTMGGGFGVVSAEACERQGLQMAALSESTLSRLDGILPARWPHANPVDMAGMDTMGEQIVLECLSALIDDEGVDCILSLVPLHRYTPMMPGAAYMPSQKGNVDARAESLKAVAEKARKLGKPILSVGAMPLPVGERPAGEALWEGSSILPSPQRAATVLRHLLWYRQYLDNAKPS